MILDIDKWCKETVIEGDYIPQITSSSTRLSNGTYDPRGLFSIEYFGQERSPRWKTMYGKIVIPHPVIHPAIFYIINRRVSYLLRWINLDFGFVIDGRKDKSNSESSNHFILTNSVNNYDYCGISDLYSNSKIVVNALMETGKFDTLSAKTILARLIDRKIPIFTSNVIVMPPIFRPNDEDNKFYVKIIEEVNILKSALSSNDKILTNRILANIQSIYNYLFEDMVNKIKGKTGLIRGSMLGKNADFSGRAVIVVDPNIKPSQLGVPRTMLIRLFYPWIIHHILHNESTRKELQNLRIPTNIPSLYNLINNDLFEKSIDDRVIKVLNHVMELVIKDKVVIAKRDPVLHKLSVRGFYPVPVDDTSIHISPLVTTAFNADFDGDQMAVFVPLTTKTQQIVRENMLTTKNLWHPVKGLSFTIEKDFVLGIYTMTKDDMDSSKESLVLDNNDKIIERMLGSDAMNLPVTYKKRTNSIGRRVTELLFNDLIEVTSPVDEKKLSSFLEKVAKEDPSQLEDIMYRILQVSKVVSSIFGGTMSIKDFTMPKDLIDRKNEVLTHPDQYDVDNELSEITKEFIKRNTSINTSQLPTLLVNSGARGSAGNIKQISVAKGYVSDTSGKILPDAIGSNFVEGFKPVDYFVSSYGSRKGVVDRVLNTAKSGYLQRQMIYLVASIKSSEVRDCGTDRFLDILLTEEYAQVLEGRVLSNGATLTKEYIEKNNLIGKMIHVYSPMYCKSRGMCRRCFPDRYRKAIDNAINIGIISGNIVGERASQLIMRAFHCLDSDTVVQSKENDEYGLYTLKNLYDRYKEHAITTYNGLQEEIDISNHNIYIEDVNGSYTRALRIIRHRRNPDSPMVMVRTRDNHPLVLQDNHPIAIKSSNGSVDFMEPKDLNVARHSTYSTAVISDHVEWNTDPSKVRECFMDPYLLGAYLGDKTTRTDIDLGSYVISAPIASLGGKLYQKLDTIIRKQHSVSSVFHLDDKEIHVHDAPMAEKLYESCGRYSYDKHLPKEMLYYDNRTLSSILCGIIDTGGMIVYRKGDRSSLSCIRIEMHNLAILYQLKVICDKLGIRHTIGLQKIGRLPKNKAALIGQVYHLNLYPKEDQMDLFAESIKCFGLSTPKIRQFRGFDNQTHDSIMYRTPIIFNDALEDSYVYDIETESHTFMANGILVHNTGGAADVLYISKEAPQLGGLVNQDGMQLIALKNLRVRVIDYTNETDEDYASTDFGIVDRDSNGEEVLTHFPAIIKFNGLIAQNVKFEDNDAYLEYESGEIIGEIIATATDVTSAVMVLQSIMNHADQFDDGKDMVVELYETFRVASKIPLIYLELLVSQLMRDPQKIYYPYRLGDMKEAPKFVGIKSVASIENPTRGIMFERLLDTITNSVLIGNTNDKLMTSDLEELFAI